MNEFTITSDIDRPADEVFAFITDFDRFPDWNLNLSEVRRTGEGPPEVGTTYVFIGKQLGRSYEAPSVVTDYVPNEKFATKTTGGPFYLEVGYQCDQQPSGTRLTTTVRGESKGFFKVAEPIIVRVTKKQFEMAAETLKAMLESAH